MFEEDLTSGKYLKYPKTWATIRAYAYFYGEDQCKAWIVLSAKKDTRFLLGTVTTLLTETTGSNGVYFSIKDAPDVAVYDLKALILTSQAAAEASIFQGEDMERLSAFIDGATTWVNNIAAKQINS